MTYKAVSITELMAHEFSHVEGALDSLDERALKEVIPLNMRVDKFIEQLKQGHWLLLSDSPMLPALVNQSGNIGGASWGLNHQALNHFTPAAQTALLARTQLSGRMSGANQLQSLHPPLPQPLYVPEPPMQVDSDKPLPLKYEYSFEIACSDASFRQQVNCSFILAKTANEATLGSWSQSQTEHGTLYTILTAVEEPKRLVAQIASSALGISLKQPVQVKMMRTKTAYEGFIPISPAVQLGERLGFPTEGYYYHFHDGQLIQEYKLLGDSQWGFYGTRSTHQQLNDAQGYNMHQTALLVFWKIGGKVVENQYLVYLNQQISRYELDNLNDEWLNQHGVKLAIPALLEATKQSATQKPQAPKLNFPVVVYGLPTVAPQRFNHPLNSYYDFPERFLLNTKVKAINSNTITAKDIAIVNIRAECTLRIGVFFDGTGQNAPNDEYKESYGNKSRTNVARLYDAYPEQEGQSAKIYISGVGTVDDIPIVLGERNPIIDAGEDEKLAAQGTGAFDNTGGLWKWQSLLDDMSRIVQRLEQKNIYSEINHIQFDVFGFSRGAALARHFVNAVAAGFPDYLNPQKGPSPSALFPNLLGNERYKRFDARSTEFYAIDTARRFTVRFVGLFDTVGSFYIPGNDDEGNYQLGLQANAAERVFQICAQHEYRHNFPLTSLGQGLQTAFTQGIFCQEVFPGSHTDVGGGYPSKTQYGRTDLPARLNTPVDVTYNRELIKKVSFYDKFQQELQAIKEANAAAAFTKQAFAAENHGWQQQTRDTLGIYGEVKSVDGQLYYYHFVPISNALAGLAFERMKQQAEYHGIDWREDLIQLPEDYRDELIVSIWERIKDCPIGTISQQWADDEALLRYSYIHRPHDALINPGYGGALDSAINALDVDSHNQPKRKVY